MGRFHLCLKQTPIKHGCNSSVFQERDNNTTQILVCSRITKNIDPPADFQWFRMSARSPHFQQAVLETWIRPCFGKHWARIEIAGGGGLQIINVSRSCTYRCPEIL